MNPQLIKVSADLFINPAHVAFIERDQHGHTTVHMALAQPVQVGSGPKLPGHVAFTLSAAERDALLAALDAPSREE